MNVERLLMPVLRQLGGHDRLTHHLFRFAKWGNPWAPERFSWPYPIYDRMTADGPVVHSRTYQQWFVSGYDETLAVLRSPHASTAVVRDRILSVWPYTKLSTIARENFSRWLLLTDPPDHTRLRGAVVRAFSPRRIAELEPAVNQVVDRLLSQIDADEVDIVDAFTAPLPVDVIATLLGLPHDRWAWLRAVSTELGNMLEPMEPVDPQSINRRFDELDEVFGALVEERRRAPRDDLITALALDDEHELDRDEAVAMIALLLFAGHETTTGLLGNAIVALAQAPDQRRLLVSRPDLITDAVEELIRYDPPAQFTGRTTTAPIDVGDTVIPAGANVAIMLAAANRDRRRWPDGDRLRLDRPVLKSISFGHGIHHCLGASLARLETRVALPAFLEAFGEYDVDLTTARWKRSHTLRGPTRLVVRRCPAAT